MLTLEEIYQDMVKTVFTYYWLPLHNKWSFQLRVSSVKRPNPQETADLATFTEEIFNRKLHFWCSIPVLMVVPARWKLCKAVQHLCFIHYIYIVYSFTYPSQVNIYQPLDVAFVFITIFFYKLILARRL